MASSTSVLIKNGLVVDPANGINQQPMDILIVDGHIAKVSSTIPSDPIISGDKCVDVFDADGCIVCPGLVDLHVHCYPDTPLGIDPDEHCLTRGVTTVVDAGSAGSKTFNSFLQYLKTRKTRVFNFLHISRVGLETAGCAQDGLPGELTHLEDVNLKECVECIANNENTIVGIKIRLATSISNGGKNEVEAYRRALAASEQSKLPLMVHYSFSTVPHVGDENGLGVPGSLKKGDVLTHMCHGLGSTIVDVPTNDMHVHSSVIEAQKRGVCLDIGHGKDSFSWVVAEVAAKEGVWPDTISTDLHAMSLKGPAYDLPTVMTKLLHIGMPLYEIIKAVTQTPSKIINRDKTLGSLSQGSLGDVTILKVVDCDFLLEDSQGVKRRIVKQFDAIAAWVGGERVLIKEHCSK